MATDVSAGGDVSEKGIGIESNSVTAGDFNGDGKLDLAVSNGNSNCVYELLGNGDGTFGAPIKVFAGEWHPSLRRPI